VANALNAYFRANPDSLGDRKIGTTLSSLVSASTIESASGADVNVLMSGVDIDFRRVYNSKNPTKILSNGSAALEVSYTLKGGSITLDTLSGITVYDMFKRTVTEADSLGSCVTLNVPEGIAVPGMGIMSDGTLKIFKLNSASAGIATYKVEKSESSTPYGLVPDEYTDAELYPFVMFDENGNF